MDDLISRQAAIDAIRSITEVYINNVPTLIDKASAQTELMMLPSAQPEIIRCKDCKWWDKSKDSPFGYCMAMKHGYITANWEIGIYRKYKGDFYCADGERGEADDETGSD